MDEYKELIEQLNGACIVKVVMKDMTKADLFARAADAIEQLVKERDAAVADISRNCNLCKHWKNWMCKFDNICIHIGHEYTGWEWRGVQEDNT